VAVGKDLLKTFEMKHEAKYFVSRLVMYIGNGQNYVITNLNKE
jgi:hypothetical protein